MSRYRDPQRQVGKHHLYPYNLNKNICQSCKLNPLNAGPEYIRFSFFKYHILKMVKIKCDINQQDLKRVDHFVKSE